MYRECEDPKRSESLPPNHWIEDFSKLKSWWQVTRCRNELSRHLKVYMNTCCRDPWGLACLDPSFKNQRGQTQHRPSISIYCRLGLQFFHPLHGPSRIRHRNDGLYAFHTYGMYIWTSEQYLYIYIYYLYMYMSYNMSIRMYSYLLTC